MLRPRWYHYVRKLQTHAYSSDGPVVCACGNIIPDASPRTFAWYQTRGKARLLIVNMTGSAEVRIQQQGLCSSGRTFFQVLVLLLIILLMRNKKYHTSCETFIGGTKLEKRLCEYNWYSHAYTAVFVQQWLYVRYVKCSYRGILPMYGIAVSRN